MNIHYLSSSMDAIRKCSDDDQCSCKQLESKITEIAYVIYGRIDWGLAWTIPATFVPHKFGKISQVPVTQE